MNIGERWLGNAMWLKQPGLLLLKVKAVGDNTIRHEQQQT
jgi:hypothetical protein